MFHHIIKESLDMLTKEQTERYSRNIIIKEIGEKGQEKLLQSKVLCIGTGGLGSAILYYLTASGVGTIGVVDDECVELSNLQRQIVHFTPDIGKAKVLSAKEKLSILNPEIQIETYNERVSKSNILDLIKDYDTIIDGSDNFETRFIVNDACYSANKPLFYGAVLAVEGQVSTFIRGENHPCYRCLYPDISIEDEMPSTSKSGVLGMVPGVIGLIQATECVKYLVGIGELLVGRLLIYDALRLRFREVNLKKNPKCPLCGEKPIIKNIE